MLVGICDFLFKEITENYDECYKLAAELGYNSVDLSSREWSVGEIYKEQMSGHYDKSLEELEAYYKPMYEAATKYGIIFNQLHAPFPTARTGYPELNAYIHMTFEKCIHIARMLKSKYLVVHGVHVDNHRTVEEDFQYHLDLFSTFIPLLKEQGVVMCIENTYYYYVGRINCYSGSNSEFLVRLVEELNKMAGAECFGLCYDVGHGNITGKDQFQEILAYGDHLKVLHIHDTDGTFDTHLIPYTARYTDRQGTDWDGVLKALAKINYNGVINFESDGGILGFPKELRRAALYLNAEIGKYFSKRIEEYKKEYQKV